MINLIVKTKSIEFLSAIAVFLTLVVLADAKSAYGQTDVTQPTDPITRVNGTNDGDGNGSATSPAGEDTPNALDNTTSKYLNFLDLNSGFAVTPASGSTIVRGLRIYTANDAAERDPASYLLEGSNNGGASYTTISSGALNLPSGRNALALPLNTAGLNFQTITFTNNTGYTSYRLTFPTLKDAATATAMQIGEVELLSIAPTAASADVSGRVLKTNGRAISYALVSITNQQGVVRTVKVNGFGYFNFRDVEAGQSYVVQVSAKRHLFAPQVIAINEDISDLVLIEQP